MVMNPTWFMKDVTWIPANPTMTTFYVAIIRPNLYDAGIDATQYKATSYNGVLMYSIYKE